MLWSYFVSFVTTTMMVDMWSPHGDAEIDLSWNETTTYVPSDPSQAEAHYEAAAHIDLHRADRWEWASSIVHVDRA